jgi:hypothetical protein
MHISKTAAVAQSQLHRHQQTVREGRVRQRVIGQVKVRQDREELRSWVEGKQCPSTSLFFLSSIPSHSIPTYSTTLNNLFFAWMIIKLSLTFRPNKGVLGASKISELDLDFCLLLVLPLWPSSCEDFGP